MDTERLKEELKQTQEKYSDRSEKIQALVKDVWQLANIYLVVLGFIITGVLQANSGVKCWHGSLLTTLTLLAFLLASVGIYVKSYELPALFIGKRRVELRVSQIKADIETATSHPTFRVDWRPFRPDAPASYQTRIKWLPSLLILILLVAQIVLIGTVFSVLCGR